MLLGDLAQPLEIALRRRQHAGRSRHRLDDDGGDGGGAVQVDEALQFVGEMRAVFRLALGEGLLLAVIGVRQMIDAGQQRAEHLAVVDDAADRGAAEADAVIAALAADQAGAGALAVELVIGQRDLQRGIGGFRAGIAEEHVVEPVRREIGDAAGKLERLRNAELERRRVIERRGLLGDRFRNLGAAVAGIAAPHAGGGVDDLAAVDGEVVHVLGAGEQPRRLLERAVGGERHPVRGEIVRHVDGGGRGLLSSMGASSSVPGGDGANYQLRGGENSSASIFGRGNRCVGNLRYFERRIASRHLRCASGSTQIGGARSRTPRPRNPRYRARAAAIAG